MMMKIRMMMVMMVVVSVSAAPFPPSFNSSQDGEITESPYLHRYPQENYTRSEFGQQVNSTEFEFQSSGNTSFGIQHSLTLSRCGCPLPTCLTVNLACGMQGGDEKAGDLTKNPVGPGKK
ncbi:uncharacterized protein zgc:193726 [Xyrichtys novacula]|uniref:Uncharacterized protein zgc:193726 n=1 Tax=Xyrichtys novacula TaxID=13765 RepID=A0AAV1EZL4_XYRNO|nr:uncharacterized protein zgc:193726 [Xyrichtys novacula]